MNYLLQFLRILTITFISELLHNLLPLPIPTSIYGILILFLLLETGLMPLEKIREAGKFLIEIMPVMFIPAAVELMETWNIIAPSLLSYIFVTISSTIVVMGVSGLITQKVIRSFPAGKAAAENAKFQTPDSHYSDKEVCI